MGKKKTQKPDPHTLSERCKHAPDDYLHGVTFMWRFGPLFFNTVKRAGIAVPCPVCDFDCFPIWADTLKDVVGRASEAAALAYFNTLDHSGRERWLTLSALNYGEAHQAISEALNTSAKALAVLRLEQMKQEAAGKRTQSKGTRNAQKAR